MSHSGKDTPGCGLSSSPCATVRFAVVNESRAGDTIYIDYYNGKPYEECKTEQPVIIEKSLSLVGRNGKAVIQCVQQRNLFAVFGKAVRTVLFENLVLRNANKSIVQTLSDSHLTIKRCIVTRNNAAVYLNTTLCILEVINSTFEYNAMFGIHSAGCFYLKTTLLSSIFNLSPVRFEQYNHTKLMKVFVCRCNFLGHHGQIETNVRHHRNASFGLVYSDVEVVDIKWYESVFANYNDKTSSTRLGLTIICFEPSGNTRRKTSIILDRLTFQNNNFKSSAIYLADDYSLPSNTIKYKIVNCVFYNNSNSAITIYTKSLNTSLLQPAPVTVVLENNTFTKNYHLAEFRHLHHSNSILHLGIGKFLIISCHFFDNLPASFSIASVVFVDYFVTASFKYCYFENNGVRGKSVQIYGLPLSTISFVRHNQFNLTKLKSDQFVIVHRSDSLAKAVTTVSGSFIVQCPTGFRFYRKSITTEALKDNVTYFSLSYSCKQCPRQTYSVERGAIYNNTLVQIKCHSCPRGGQCENGVVKAKPNFWGYVNQKQVFFRSCPSRYCCSNDKCTSYNSCYGNRTGHLCGRCPKGMSEPLFSTKCRQNQQCNSSTFWFGVSLLVLLSFLFFLYQSEITTFLLNGLSFRRYVRFRPVSNSDVCNEYSGFGSVFRKESTGTAYLKIIFYYYQIVHIFKSGGEWSNEQSILDRLQDLFTKLLNLIITNLSFFDFDCPLQNLIPIKKTVLLHSLGFCLLGISIVTWLFFKLYETLRKRKVASIHTVSFSSTIPVETESQTAQLRSFQNFPIRILCAFIHICLLMYSSSAQLVFTLLQCVPFRDHQILFIDGTVRCYQTFQYVLMAYAVVYTLPFFLVPVLGHFALITRQISVLQFCLGCLFPLPFCCYWFYLLVKQNRSQIECDDGLTMEEEMVMNNANAVSKLAVIDTLSGPFRIHDKYFCSRSFRLPWEGILIFRRLIIIIAFTFIYERRVRMTVILAICVTILVSHVYVKPFKYASENFVETLSLSILTILCGFTLVKALYHGEDYSSYSSSSQLIHNLNITESILILAPIMTVTLVAVFRIFVKLVFLVSFLVTFIYRKLRCLFNSVSIWRP